MSGVNGVCWVFETVETGIDANTYEKMMTRMPVAKEHDLGFSMNSDYRDDVDGRSFRICANCGGVFEDC